MIHHLSIAARDPQHVAGVLAEFMGGVGCRFRRIRAASSRSNSTSTVGRRGLSGRDRVAAGRQRRRRLCQEAGGRAGFGPTHSAQADAVTAIAEREGWQCHRCNRGPFHVIEVWVENELMVEILPPEYAAEYLASTNPAKVAASMAGAPARPSRQRAA